MVQRLILASCVAYLRPAYLRIRKPINPRIHACRSICRNPASETHRRCHGNRSPVLDCISLGVQVAHLLWDPYGHVCLLQLGRQILVTEINHPRCSSCGRTRCISPGFPGDSFLEGVLAHPWCSSLWVPRLYSSRISRCLTPGRSEAQCCVWNNSSGAQDMEAYECTGDNGVIQPVIASSQ